MSRIWNINNGTSLQISEGVFYTYTLPVLSDLSTTKFSLITGKLPKGMRLVNNKIEGTPLEVSRLTPYSFVIRASYEGIIEDRTFTFTIDGADDPNWITNSGNLPVGPNNSYYILDETYVDFQLRAYDFDTTAGQSLKFWIASSKDGMLPSGLTLTESGRIYGWVKPLLLVQDPLVTGYYGTTYYDVNGYDYGVVNTATGYGEVGYESLSYDYIEPILVPKKLNRNYEFIVTLSDGDTHVRRKFNIYVVGDSLTVDTTYTIDDTTLITADSAFVREPVWKTPSDLGTFRASNYKTIQFEIYQLAEKTPVSYFLNATNPDGSLSIVPPGLDFDKVNAELYGVIPYQAAITKTYTFTITAVRIGHLQEIQPDVTEYDAPILLDDSYTLYRNTSMVTAEYNTIYATLLYVENTSGIILRKGDTQWVYRNNITGLTLYADSAFYYPWDITAWFSDVQLTTPVDGPTIIMLSSGGTYSDEFQSASSSRTFTINIIGEIDNYIKWVTPSNMGTIEANQVSMLNVKANSSKPLYYQLTNGRLPFGLTLSSNGDIMGCAYQYASSSHFGLTTFDCFFDNNTTTFDREYLFEVTASDSGNTISSVKLFMIKVLTPNITRFSDISVKPLLKPEQRDLFKKFMYNTDIFEYDAIYRLGDDNFGIRYDLDMLIYSGFELQSKSNLYQLINRRKQFTIGSLKSAKARITGTTEVLYEVVYLEIQDPLEIGKVHLPRVITTSGENKPITIDNSNKIEPIDLEILNNRLSANEITYDQYLAELANIEKKSDPFSITIDSNVVIADDPYLTKKFPSSISLWRSQIKSLGKTDRHYMPLWMRTIQDGSMIELDYVPAVVLCYCKPGKADTIIANIKNSNFNFNQINYDIDRFIISEVTEYSDNLYLHFRSERTITT